MEKIEEQKEKTLKIVVENDELYYTTLGKIIQEAAATAIENDRLFTFGVSGGSVAQILAKTLPSVSTTWEKWLFFFCDERVVPLHTADSTYGYYKANLVGKIPITEERFVKINPDLSAEDAAKDYIKKMSVYFPPDRMPQFDMLLLGVGEDGHTCSLFPNHKLLNETSLWVCPINDSPKPPPSRITFTLPLINNTTRCIFPVKGANKAEIIKKILEDEEDLPATRVKPIVGDVIWYLDESAAKLLKSES